MQAYIIFIYKKYFLSIKTDGIIKSEVHKSTPFADSTKLGKQNTSKKKWF